MVQKRQFKEGLMLFQRFTFCQLKPEEAIKVFDISHLTLDSQTFLICGTLHVVVPDTLLVCLKLLHEYKQTTDHGTCSSLSRFAMDYNCGLYIYTTLFLFILFFMTVLFHLLQIEACIKAEIVHLLNRWHIVIREWELSERTWFNCLLVI